MVSLCLDNNLYTVSPQKILLNKEVLSVILNDVIFRWVNWGLKFQFIQSVKRGQAEEVTIISVNQWIIFFILSFLLCHFIIHEIYENISLKKVTTTAVLPFIKWKCLVRAFFSWNLKRKPNQYIAVVIKVDGGWGKKGSGTPIFLSLFIHWSFGSWVSNSRMKSSQRLSDTY